MKKFLKILVPVVITCTMIVPVYADSNEVMVISAADDVSDIVAADDVSADDGYIDGMPSPITEYSEIDELIAAVGFDVVSPSVPSNYKLSLISDVSGEIAQLIYANNDDEICYRMAKGKEDISGDYNIYTTVTRLKVNDADIRLKGNGGKIYLALWAKEGYTYSISFDEGLSLKEAESIIKSIKF